MGRVEVLGRRVDALEQCRRVRLRGLLRALQRAEQSPQPDPASLLEGVYATPEDLDTPHHK